MGWSYTWDKGVGRKELVAEILGDFRRNQYPYPSLLDHSQRGNTLYMLLHKPARRPECVRREPAEVRTHDLGGLEFRLIGNYRFIAVYLLAGGGRIDCGWGYKAMDESVGPSVADCPERLLKESQVEDRYGWRARCRKVREEAKRRREWIKTLQPGTTLQMHRGWRQQKPIYEEVVFDYPYSKTFFVGHFKGKYTQYRMRWTDVKMPEETEHQEAA